MATLINQTVNTGSTTNKELSAASLTVEEATSDAAFLVEDAVGPVYAPYNFRNQAANTGSLTNQAVN